MFKKILPFLLVVSAIVHATFEGKRLVRETASKLCPFTNFCYTNASKILKRSDRVPCCRPCFCDDDCWALGNCCPDKEDKLNKPVPNNLTCKDSFVKRLNTDRGQARRYKIVDVCPNAEQATNTSEKCSGEKTSIEDYIWVSDENGTIFQNMHCAECHGIKTVLHWKLRTKCGQIFHANFITFSDVLLSDNCNIRIEAPEQLRAVTEKYQCYDEYFRFPHCNITGLWSHSNTDIETACEQSIWPYLSLGSYKNMFCFLCNHDSDTGPYEACSDPFGSMKGKIPYSFLIDYEKFSGDAKEKKEPYNNCAIDEVMDTFMNHCRTLVCSVGTAPYYGRCDKLVLRLDGMAMIIPYYLDTQSNQTSLYMNLNDSRQTEIAGQAIFNTFLDVSNFKGICEVDDVEVRQTATNNSLTGFTLRAIVVLDTTCDFTTALERSVDVIGKTISVSLGDDDLLDLKINLDRQAEYIDKSSRRIFTSIREPSIVRRFRVYTLDTDIYCPRIEMSYYDLSLFSVVQYREKRRFESLLKEIGVNNEIRSTYMCLDNYVQFMSKLNKSASVKQNEIVFILSAFSVACRKFL